jgi:hypothetical protein
MPITGGSNDGQLIEIILVNEDTGLSLPSGTQYIIVEGCGGGGGGGGTESTDPGFCAVGAGGGGGAFGKVQINVALSGSLALSCTIGYGGIGGGGNENGAPGGTTQLEGVFGLLLFPGGDGGVGSDATIVPPFSNVGAAGGVIPTLDLASSGWGQGFFMSRGTTGGSTQANSLTDGISGSGANGPYGAGGSGKAAFSSNGDDGTGYGSGGSGAYSLPNTVGTGQGGAGAQGFMLISCYR